MSYSYITPLGSFSDGNTYRAELIKAGYKDLGWQNGWGNNSANELLWDQQKALESRIEIYQWNRSGSDCTYVLHQNKIFCSVDMGD
jgi:hypothetical protein